MSLVVKINEKRLITNNIAIHLSSKKMSLYSMHEINDFCILSYYHEFDKFNNLCRQ